MGSTDTSNINTTLALFFIFLSLCSVSSQGKFLGEKQQREPCNNLTFYIHDILYNGSNAGNATSAIVAAPEGGNLTTLAKQNHFGNIVVFNDPLTKNNDLRAEPVGMAQGFYLYDNKDTFTAWYGFTIVLNSTEHRGTLQLMGADPILVKSRDLSVVGGTGDFFMTRGIATLITDSFEGEVYFRLQIDIKLYECW
ncbi:disease resistance response protein 206-like [Malania oleifera]|uniref:disease resistance response protein 206-like n=1 Tax=Malania oleifera TaxID=397392 RepID=UPI0025ADA18F|nr:disease resistance response protein 206-like [Malania oleifera]XP_057969309.1 disease resistance response protein 206-like [Malania oleifera]